MGIHTNIDPFDAEEFDADVSAAADEMLKQVLSDYAKERVREANASNRAIAGDWVPYSVAIDGKKVYEGLGEVFPENQIAAFRPHHRTARDRQREANIEFGRRLKEIIVDWFWSKIEMKALETIIRRLVREADVWTNRYQIIENMYLAYQGSYGDSIVELLLFRLQGRISFRGIRMLLGSHRALRYLVRSRHLLDGGRNSGEDEPVRWVARELVARSPVRSGAYRAGHILLVDGAQVGTAETVAGGSDIPFGQMYEFVNTEPYSRKIEIGKTRDGRDFVIQVPARIYERVADDAQREYPDVEVTFSMQDKREMNNIASSPVITIRM